MTTHTTTIRILAPVLLAALAVAACGDDDTAIETGDPGGETPTTTVVAEPGSLEEAQAALDTATARWAEAEISDYTYTYSPVCFCLESEVTVTVAGGEIVDWTAEGDGPAAPMTVEDVFAELQAAIDDGAASVQAQFDPELGFPVSTYIDVDEMMADEEHGIAVSAFEAA